MIVRLLTEHHLVFLSLKGGCTGSSESTLVKVSNCWKSRAGALMLFSLQSYTSVKKAKFYAKTGGSRALTGFDAIVLMCCIYWRHYVLKTSCAGPNICGNTVPPVSLTGVYNFFFHFE